MAYQITPARISYTGLYADQHVLDVRELARSLDGIGRLANSVLHFYLNGTVEKDDRAFKIKYYAGPPQENGVLIEIVALLSSAQLPLWAPQAFAIAEDILPRLWSAIISLGAGNSKLSEMHCGLISQAMTQSHEQAVANNTFAREVHAGHMADKAWLQQHIDKLTEYNRPALRDIPAPVGGSCRHQTIWKDSVQPTEIDEPTAKALKSSGKEVVGDMQKMRVQVDGIIHHNRQLKVENPEKPGSYITAHVRDPAFENSPNAYTDAAVNRGWLMVDSKATYKDGKLSTLYIMNAEATASGT